jgi:hypothetical protein
MLDKKGKRRYAKSINRIESGTYGEKPSLFFKIDLTTREGDDNTPERLKRDIKKLMVDMRVEHDIEYVFAIGETPDKGLVHTHGLLRVKGGFLKLYDGDVKDNRNKWRDNRYQLHSEHIDANRKALGDMWNRIHGAFVVQLQPVNENFKNELHRYIVKHIMKDYIMIPDNRLMVSSGWSHHEHEDMVNQFKAWWMRQDDASWLSSTGWSVVNQLIQIFYERKAAVIKHKKTGSVGLLKKDGRFYEMTDMEAE